MNGMKSANSINNKRYHMEERKSKVENVADKNERIK